MLRLLIVLVSILLHGPLAQGQDGISRKQQEKRLAKKEKEDQKAKVQAEKEGRKRHLSIQDKQTRKRLKRHTRRADKRGSGTHRDGWQPFQRRR